MSYVVGDKVYTDYASYLAIQAYYAQQAQSQATQTPDPTPVASAPVQSEVYGPFNNPLSGGLTPTQSLPSISTVTATPMPTLGVVTPSLSPVAIPYYPSQPGSPASQESLVSKTPEMWSAPTLLRTGSSLTPNDPLKDTMVQKLNPDYVTFMQNQAAEGKNIQAEMWWNSMTPIERLGVGGNTVAMALISRPIDYIFSKGNPEPFETLAYDTQNQLKANYQDHGYIGGFGDTLLQNQAAQVTAQSYLLGYGIAAGSRAIPTLASVGSKSSSLLSSVSKWSPETISTRAGYLMLGVGGTKVLYDTYQGDYRSAATELALFAAALPYGIAGFQARSPLKITLVKGDSLRTTDSTFNIQTGGSQVDSIRYNSLQGRTQPAYPKLDPWSNIKTGDTARLDNPLAYSALYSSIGAAALIPGSNIFQGLSIEYGRKAQPLVGFSDAQLSNTFQIKIGDRTLAIGTPKIAPDQVSTAYKSRFESTDGLERVFSATDRTIALDNILPRYDPVNRQLVELMLAKRELSLGIESRYKLDDVPFEDVMVDTHGLKPETVQNVRDYFSSLDDYVLRGSMVNKAQVMGTIKEPIDASFIPSESQRLTLAKIENTKSVRSEISKMQDDVMEGRMSDIEYKSRWSELTSKVEPVTQGELIELYKPVYDRLGIDINKLDVPIEFTTDLPSDLGGFVESHYDPATTTKIPFTNRVINPKLIIDRIVVGTRGKDYDQMTHVSGHEVGHASLRGGLGIERYVGEPIAIKSGDKFVDMYNRLYGTSETYASYGGISDAITHNNLQLMLPYIIGTKVKPVVPFSVKPSMSTENPGTSYFRSVHDIDVNYKDPVKLTDDLYNLISKTEGPGKVWKNEGEVGLSTERSTLFDIHPLEGASINKKYPHQSQEYLGNKFGFEFEPTEVIGGYKVQSLSDQTTAKLSAISLRDSVVSAHPGRVGKDTFDTVYINEPVLTKSMEHSLNPITRYIDAPKAKRLDSQIQELAYEKISNQEVGGRSGQIKLTQKNEFFENVRKLQEGQSVGSKTDFSYIKQPTHEVVQGFRVTTPNMGDIDLKTRTEEISTYPKQSEALSDRSAQGIGYNDIGRVSYRPSRYGSPAYNVRNTDISQGTNLKNNSTNNLLMASSGAISSLSPSRDIMSSISGHRSAPSSNTVNNIAYNDIPYISKGEVDYSVPSSSTPYTPRQPSSYAPEMPILYTPEISTPITPFYPPPYTPSRPPVYDPDYPYIPTYPPPSTSQYPPPYSPEYPPPVIKVPPPDKYDSVKKFRLPTIKFDHKKKKKEQEYIKKKQKPRRKGKPIFWNPAGYENVTLDEFQLPSGERALHIGSRRQSNKLLGNQLRGSGSIPTLRQYNKQRRSKRK